MMVEVELQPVKSNQVVGKGFHEDSASRHFVEGFSEVVKEAIADFCLRLCDLRDRVDGCQQLEFNAQKSNSIGVQDAGLVKGYVHCSRGCVV